ncbi:hypothetical protein CBR_g23727 [Chara braunii]|uniref:Reverse transcriptase domain-containing protein n=1 Tax=Chara braunii TaxID=69332 RepID=A0A388L516_CHABU|nr:hypothetical protein CBR_g23727 [Chara braunii]|eukprot:GBG77396.1 hypothetical protein CBR_g23727 [Chara braunii]
MKTFRVDKFAVLPIRHTTAADDFAFERYLIHDMCPSLNTMGTGRKPATMNQRRKGKRERNRRGKISIGLPVVKFSTDGGERTSLLNWLQENVEGAKTPKNVRFSARQHWLDGWKRICALFGSSEVRIEGNDMRLNQAKKPCQEGREVVFTRIRRTPTTTERNKRTLLSLLRHSRLTTTLTRYSTNKLVGLYRTTCLFGRKETRYKLKIKIDQAIRRKTKVSVRRKVTVKYPFSASVLKSEVRRKTETVIEKKVADNAVADLVKRRVRVVCTKNKTVGEIIHNHRRFANTGQVTCGCQSFKLDKHDGHVLTRLYELDDVPAFVKNARNVTKPTVQHNRETIRQSIGAATTHLRGKVIDELDVESCLSNEDKGVAWTEQDVRRWAKQFDGLVLIPVDRNPGDTAIICPVLYRHAFGKTFTWNPDYKKVDRTEEEVMKLCKQEYETVGLTSVGKWKIDGKIGKTYVIHKDKDLLRLRPIAPACSDPAALGQRRCARALNYLLNRFSRKRNFHIKSAYEMTEELEVITKKLQSSDCTTTMGRCYDIKEMFSSLSHASVKDAVSDMVTYFEEQGWKQVKVATRGKKCTLSKTKKKEEGYVTVELDTIPQLVNYDLRHSYMRCGNIIKRQTVGIPMGKTTSPVMATVTCAMAEERFLSSQGADRKLVAGWRMVNDVSIVVVCSNTEESWRKAGKILNNFQESYDKNLKLIRKDADANHWHFIGGRMYSVGDPVQVHFVQETKNSEPLSTTGKLRYQPMQDFASYLEKAVKKGVLSVTLKRLWRSSTAKALCVTPIAYAITESILRGYTPEVSLGALSKLARATKDGILRLLLGTFRLILDHKKIRTRIPGETPKGGQMPAPRTLRQ